MNRNLIFYILVIVIFGSILWLVFNQGSKLDGLHSTATNAQSSGLEPSAVDVFSKSLSENLEHPLSLLLIQIVVIVFSSKLLASLVRRIGQPMVIGEVIAGILLG